jgi:hypothetical protein
MAPSLQLYEKKYWNQVAMGIANDPENNHTLVMLSHAEKHNFTKYPDYTLRNVKNDSDNFQILQIPDIRPLKSRGQSSYNIRFHYYMWSDEEFNYKKTESQYTHAYFKNKTFVEFLKEQNFDVGIGTHFLSDSLLFRALGIPYIKIYPEDVEAYTMQFKFGMPVMLSSYPNSKTYNNYEYGNLPSRDSQPYRM